MTTDVLENPTAVAEEQWDDDPSNPAPAREFSSELEEGVLTISAYIDLQTNSVRPSFGEENDLRILKQCQNYADKSGGYSYTLWFLEAEGISVVRSDGEPFRISDILKLRSKKGDRLGSNQAHALLAKRFEALGVNASFTSTKSPDTALGHRFHFKSEKLIDEKSKNDPKAQQFAKPVSLVPVKMYGDDEHFVPEPNEDGTVRDYPRVVTPKAKDGEEGAASDGGASMAIPEAQVIETLRSILAGKKPNEMMTAILDEPSLASVATVFGVALLESATDESLVTVLQENRCMAISGDGTLQPI